ncbi:TPA: phage tail protein [Escherichia coli]|nr:phage tail protein [Escherichia coli]
MTTKYFAILTHQGAARLANATMLGTKLNITQMAVGDGNGTLPTPDPAQTKLINQRRIKPINSLAVDANDASQIIAEQIIPENEGGFFIREIGLYDDDGILIAVANCPETYKPLLAEGSGRTQTIRMILVVSSTSAITLKIDPSVVLATRKYVDDAVIEVKSYADKLMKDHEAKANPHKQYPLIANALKEMADAGLVAEVLKNLGLGEGSFGFRNLVAFTTAGVTSWTVPEELRNGRKCYVKVIGGGASGGIGSTTASAVTCGGGGGGGGVAEGLVDLTGINSVSITVGAGGAPVSGISVNGKNGGSSSFGTYMSASGGYSGGQPSGGLGAVGVGGTINTSLGPGYPGSIASAASGAGNGGSGGGPGGAGSFRDTANGKAVSAVGPGGGGAGLCPNSSTGQSGAGADGAVYIYW